MNYVDIVEIHDGAGASGYYISATHAKSADTAWVASSYSFSANAAWIYDSFNEFMLPTPYKFSNPIQHFMTSANITDNVVSSYATTASVYQQAAGVWSQVATANAKIYSQEDTNILHAADSKISECNWAIWGSFTQAASVSTRTEGDYWLVPIDFSVYSTLRTMHILRLWDSTYMDDKNVKDINNEEYHIQRPPSWHGLDIAFGKLRVTAFGSILPGSFFPEAGLTDIPTYLAGNDSYRLNTQYLTGYANDLHVQDISNCDFVQFINSINSLTDCEILFGRIFKSNDYDRAKRVHYVADHNLYHPTSVQSASIFSARKIDDSHGSVNGLVTNSVLSKAFINDAGAYLPAVTGDCLYHEYAFYCKMLKSTYTTSAAATAALQSLIDAYTYKQADEIDFTMYHKNNNIIPSSTLVFNMPDEYVYSQLR